MRGRLRKRSGLLLFSTQLAILFSVFSNFQGTARSWCCTIKRFGCTVNFAAGFSPMRCNRIQRKSGKAPNWLRFHLLCRWLVGWLGGRRLDVFSWGVQTLTWSVIWFEISPHQAPLIGVVSERLQISNLHPSLTHSLRALRSYKHFSFDIWTPEVEFQLRTKTYLCVDITKSVEPLRSHPLECILLLICALLFVYCVFWRLCAVVDIENAVRL